MVDGGMDEPLILGQPFIKSYLRMTNHETDQILIKEMGGSRVPSAVLAAGAPATCNKMLPSVIDSDGPDQLSGQGPCVINVMRTRMT